MLSIWFGEFLAQIIRHVLFIWPIRVVIAKDGSKNQNFIWNWKLKIQKCPQFGQEDPWPKLLETNVEFEKNLDNFWKKSGRQKYNNYEGEGG